MIGGRFLLPLAIPFYPLPAIIGCLILDGVDQSIFQWFGYDPPGYQSYDKAMDVYYLAIAYLATMRNWQSLPAVGVARFLYYYRLVGVLAFEVAQSRALLMVFPNTFEYFFIAYEAIRTRWSPLRLVLAGWITVAALIWVLVKLPQEWWIHVAKLDLTDELAAHWWAPPLMIVVLVVAASLVWVLARPRLGPPEHPWRIVADPLPEAMDTAVEQAAWRAERGAVLSWTTAEKVVLVGLLAVIYGQTLPGLDVGKVELFVGIGIVVVANSAISLAAARRRRVLESSLLAFVAMTLVNIAIVVVEHRVLGERSLTRLAGTDAANLFFLSLISLITVLFDRFHAVVDYRREGARVSPADR